MIAISHAISTALLHFAWEGLLIAILVWVALWTLRNGSARHRYLVSCVALATMTVLPIVTAWLVYRAPTTAGPNPVVNVSQSASPSVFYQPASLPAWITTLESWALPVWSLGVLGFAVRLIWISRYVAALEHSGETAEAPLIDTITHLSRRMSVREPVRVLISRLTDTPCVVGWLRPLILLPAATLLGLSAEQLETVLAHELAHIRRRDYLVNLLQSLSETLLFYHPAIWWVSASIRHERELCCDDMVVATCGDAIGYARALTKLERLRIVTPELAMSSTGGSLLYRIQRLTGVPREDAPSKIPAVVSLVLAMVCCGITAHWAHGQPQAGQDAAVSRNDVWIDTVKHGDMTRMVRALGTILSSTTAELNVVANQIGFIQLGQAASLSPRPGLVISGTVARTESSAAGGTVSVGIDLRGPFPEFVGSNVDGTIQIGSLKDVVYVGRSASEQPNGSATLFKIEQDGVHATRVSVRFGAASLDAIQVLEGLQTGDRVILSDMRKFNGYDRIRLE